MKLKLKKEKGETLAAIVIAIAIMAIAIVSLLYGVSNSIQAIDYTSDTRKAMNLARSQMEYVKAQAFKLVGPEDPDTDTPDNEAIYPPGETDDVDDQEDEHVVTHELDSDYEIDVEVTVEATNPGGDPIFKHFTVTVVYGSRDVTLEGYKALKKSTN